MTSEPKTFDLNCMMTNFAGMDDLAKRAATEFVMKLPEMLEQLRGAIADADAKLVERHAHNLKGTVSVFFAEAAFQLAFALEKGGKAGSLANAESSLLALEEELKLLKSDLIQYLKLEVQNEENRACS